MSESESESAAEARIVELELRYTEQQRTLEQLNEVVVAQQKQIDTLVLEVARLKKRVDVEPGLVDATDREPPPHY